LRPGALGDCILTLPAFELIQVHFAGLRPVLASSPAGCRVARLSGLFGDTCPYESPDLAALFVDGIERDGLFRDVGALVAFGAGGAGEIAERARRAGVSATASVDTWPDADGPHVARQFLDRTAEALGFEAAGDAAFLAAAHDSRMPADDFSTPEGEMRLPPIQVRGDSSAWAARPGYRVAVAPGAGSPTKCWPAEHFAEACGLLLESHRVHLMLLLGPAEMERPEVREAFARLPCSVSECWSVPDLASTLAACDLYIGNDSGLSHLAAWAGTEVLALFGPTDPGLWAPLGRTTTLSTHNLEPAQLAENAGRALEWSA
jgi:hypothetical protein